MIHQPTAKPETIGATAVRQGRVGFLLLGVLTIAFLCGIVAINAYFATLARVQQENSTDAAALAAAEVLAREDLLYGDPSIFGLTLPQTPTANQPLFGLATQSALNFAAKNYVGGKPFAVQAEDVAFSLTDVRTRSSLGLLPAAVPPNTPAPTPLTLAQMRALNAVQVTGRNTNARGNALRWPIFTGRSWEIVGQSVAVLDGYVYGFHTDPTGAINIPLAPIGLNAQRWSAHVESLADPALATPANGPLRFGDFKVMLGAIAQDPDYHDSSRIAPMLQLCTTILSEAAAQLNPANPGITPAQYGVFFQANNNQPLALDRTTLQLAVPTLPQPNASNTDVAALQANLAGLQTNGTRLIWPLISGYNNASPPQASITGFVAARIVNLQRVSYRLRTHANGVTMRDSKEPGTWEEGVDAEGHRRHRYDLLELTLHPTMLATSTGVVFVRDWPAVVPFRFPNAYVKKIRLIR